MKIDMARPSFRRKRKIRACEIARRFSDRISAFGKSALTIASRDAIVGEIVMREGAAGVRGEELRRGD
jgi:hypothetical protein